MQKRLGLSLVEFLGCSVALVGGAGIGTYYLGYDVMGMAYEMLERSQVVELGTPEQDAPQITDPDAAPPNMVPGPSLGASRETAFAAGAPWGPEHKVSRQGAADDRAAEAAAAAARPVKMTAARQQATTKGYWDAFAAYIYREVKTRSPVVKINQERWQLLDYLSLRKKGHQQTIASLRQLDGKGVDKSLLAYAKTVLDWHESGEHLFAQAVTLLTNGPRAVLSGPFAQSWQSAATQHRMEERLVRNKHRVILGYLNHTYASLAPFPPAFPN